MCVCARLRMSERAGEGRGRVAERQRASEVSVCLEWRYPARKQSFLALCLPLAASPSPSTPLTFFSSPLFLRRAYRLASRGRRRVQWAAELNVSRAAARELFAALHFVTHFTQKSEWHSHARSQRQSKGGGETGNPQVRPRDPVEPVSST